MADNGTVIGLVALATAVFTGLGLLLKHIRHSECMSGCCEIDTRSPARMDSIISAPPPTPQALHRNRHNAESDAADETKSEFRLDIIEIQV